MSTSSQYMKQNNKHKAILHTSTFLSKHLFVCFDKYKSSSLNPNSLSLQMTCKNVHAIKTVELLIRGLNLEISTGITTHGILSSFF